MSSSQAPAWFRNAINAPYEETYFECLGISIRALRWRDPKQPGLPMIALHGGMAHADWWRFVAPSLVPKYDLVAIDFSGHGESGHRDKYQFEYWVEEVCTAAKRFFGEQPVVLLGHSMGGLIAVKTVAKHPDLWRALVISDSPVHRPFGQRSPNEEPPNFKRDYPDFETGVRRFRLLPPQPITHEFMTRFIAESSLKQLQDGTWTWKFDPDLFASGGSVFFAEDLAQLKPPMWFLRAAQSKIVPAETRRALARHCRNSWRWIQVEDAFHHIMLDQPHIFVQIIKDLPIA